MKSTREEDLFLIFFLIEWNLILNSIVLFLKQQLCFLCNVCLRLTPRGPPVGRRLREGGRVVLQALSDLGRFFFLSKKSFKSGPWAFSNVNNNRRRTLEKTSFCTVLYSVLKLELIQGFFFRKFFISYHLFSCDSIVFYF